MMLGKEKEKIKASDIPKSANGSGGKDLDQGLSEELRRKASELIARAIAQETFTKPPSKFTMAVGDFATRRECEVIELKRKTVEENRDHGATVLTLDTIISRLQGEKKCIIEEGFALNLVAIRLDSA
ncbi:hypothetical protein L1987_48305 [Smallanthus sonchifolius]|uniref:Uncharacterized protein n=1 Tax=Smallanthus sonchifolius TaxID=185202 RepID=A0ACB9FS81_9ASTR|nr:hypothetical protein L1987_48305 [Smallanthus sonchifolius]